MQFDKKTLARIYRRTSGYCHLCHAKLSLKTTGNQEREACGRLNILCLEPRVAQTISTTFFAACVSCNLDKSNRTTRTDRGWNGKTCAPLNPNRRKEAKFKNGFARAIAYGFAGGAIAGPVGAIVGVVTGACVGSSTNPDR